MELSQDQCKKCKKMMHCNDQLGLFFFSQATIFTCCGDSLSFSKSDSERPANQDADTATLSGRSLPAYQSQFQQSRLRRLGPPSLSSQSLLCNSDADLFNKGLKEIENVSRYVHMSQYSIMTQFQSSACNRSYTSQSHAASMCSPLPRAAQSISASFPITPTIADSYYR